MTNLVPWREPSRALLRERMAVLVDRCAAVGAHVGVPDVVHAARDRADSITANIGAHVPSELLPRRLGAADRSGGGPIKGGTAVSYRM